MISLQLKVIFIIDDLILSNNFFQRNIWKQFLGMKLEELSKIPFLLFN